MLPQVVPSLRGRAVSKERPEIPVRAEERNILRALAASVADIAVLPIQSQRREMWSDINELKETKPMIWVDEVCWNEFEPCGELGLQTESAFCQDIERQLRRVLYQWNHFQCDSVVEPVLYSPPCVEDSGIGIQIKERTIESEQDSEVVSHQYERQIDNEEDIEKIECPAITHDAAASEEIYQVYRYLFDGVIEVEKGGLAGFWFAPWDDIVRLLGAQETLLSLVARPRFSHKLISRLVEVYLHCLDQYEDLGLLALNNTNVRIGSGAYGYTRELPTIASDPLEVRPGDLWGCAAAQIFSSVSPAMHEEFALQYERRWLERFGLSYYGCCEPLHEKIDLLQSVTNLRKVSVSPWAEMELAAEAISNKYVLSLKPNPALLAKDQFVPDEARHVLEEKLSTAKRYGCRVEIVLKDISTVRREPARLSTWANIAEESCRRIYGA
jgi:hypothetical protein